MVRLKNRYLLVNILYPKPMTTPAKPTSTLPEIVQFHQPTSDKMTPQLLLKLIRDGVIELFGDYGAGMMAGSLAVKYLSAATSTAIIRVTRSHYRLVWAALSFVTKLPHPVNNPCVMHVVRISGTIRKSEEEAIKRARASVLKVKEVGGQQVGAEVILKSMSDQSGAVIEDQDEDSDTAIGIEDDDAEGDDEIDDGD